MSKIILPWSYSRWSLANRLEGAILTRQRKSCDAWRLYEANPKDSKEVNPSLAWHFFRPKDFFSKKRRYGSEMPKPTNQMMQLERRFLFFLFPCRMVYLFQGFPLTFKPFLGGNLILHDSISFQPQQYPMTDPWDERYIYLLIYHKNEPKSR